jgi:hypothetical protein
MACPLQLRLTPDNKTLFITANQYLLRVKMRKTRNNQRSMEAVIKAWKTSKSHAPPGCLQIIVFISSFYIG